MRIFLIVFITSLFLIAGNTALAQDSVKLKSWHDSLALSLHDSSKARLLNAIGWQYHNSNPDTALYFVKQALALAEKSKDKKNIALSKYYIGRLFYTMSKDDTALQYFNEALALDEELNNINDMSIVHMYKGYVYKHMNRDADMLNEFLTSLSLAEKSGDNRRMSDALYSIGDYYLHTKAPDSVSAAKAKQYFLQALDIDKKLDLKSNIATDFQYLGLCDLSMGNTKGAEKYILTALSMFKELGDNFHVATAYSYLGNLYDATNDLDKSLENYLASLKMMESFDAKLEAADNADNIASEYMRKKDYSNAEKYAKLGLTLAKEVNAERQMVYLYNTLAKIAVAKKDFENAYNYKSLSAALEDSVAQKEQRDNLNELQTRYETEKKEKENQLLKLQNAATSAQLQNNRILLIAAAAGILMLAILLYLLYRNRQTKIRNIETLQTLNKTLEAQKEEISRINTLLELKALHAQMNPHFIFNCMSSIQECMLTGRLNEANIYLSKLSRLLRMVLVHSDDENIPLEKELELLQLYLELESVRLKGGFIYNIDVDEDLPAEELSVPTLIIQPFAENAIWHGLLNKPDNRKLNILLRIEDDMLYCIIEDNGIGREQAALIKNKHKQHVSKGMSLIEKRLDIIRQQTQQAKVGIYIQDLYSTSKEALGTRVEIILPLIIN